MRGRPMRMTTARLKAIGEHLEEGDDLMGACHKEGVTLSLYKRAYRRLKAKDKAQRRPTARLRAAWKQTLTPIRARIAPTRGADTPRVRTGPKQGKQGREVVATAVKVLEVLRGLTDGYTLAVSCSMAGLAVGTFKSRRYALQRIAPEHLTDWERLTLMAYEACTEAIYSEERPDNPLQRVERAVRHFEEREWLNGRILKFTERQWGRNDGLRAGMAANKARMRSALWQAGEHEQARGV